MSVAKVSQTGIPSYGRIRALGHREIASLLDGDVVVQEKVDGSQVSAAVVDGKLVMRSKGATIDTENPPALFSRAVETFTEIFWRWADMGGHVYRGEALHRPKHNTIAYSRAPEAGVVLFDIDRPDGSSFEPSELADMAQRLDLEAVPCFYEGPGSGVTMDRLTEWLERESCLGGAKVEGVVIKAVDRFGDDGKHLMGKYVSESFKESHRKDWKVRNPNRKDVVAAIVESYRTERRWEKTVEHARDDGKLLNEPKDIGLLIRAIQDDIREECEDEIKKVLFDHFWKDVRSGVVRGFPEFYKTLLAKSQFESSAA